MLLKKYVTLRTWRDDYSDFEDGASNSLQNHPQIYTVTSLL